jgi:hypothetical protein
LSKWWILNVNLKQRVIQMSAKFMHKNHDYHYILPPKSWLEDFNLHGTNDYCPLAIVKKLCKN